MGGKVGMGGRGGREMGGNGWGEVGMGGMGGKWKEEWEGRKGWERG